MRKRAGSSRIITVLGNREPAGIQPGAGADIGLGAALGGRLAARRGRLTPDFSLFPGS
jgi:hypothetical protein